MQDFKSSTPCINSDHPDIQSLADQLTKDCSTNKEKAIALYYKVRDGWKYNPYNIDFNVENLKASLLLQREEGHCIDKAIILIALARASGIPARLCLAKVRNHIATEKLEEELGTNVLVPHGYAELWIEEKWVKATPAFNKELCNLLKVAPLEFDGEVDSVFQEYDRSGADFMEYLEDYGHFEEVPVDLMYKLMKQHYPAVFERKNNSSAGFQITLL